MGAIAAKRGAGRMNRSDIKAPTEALIEISQWCSENLSHDRMKVKVTLDLYMGDFEGDAVAGRLSGAGKWCHLQAIEEARRSRPPGSLEGDVFKALVVEIGKRDRKLMKILWPRHGSLRWNRGTLKTVIATLGTKLARGSKSFGAKPDPMRDFALEMIGRTAPSDSLRYLSTTCDSSVTERAKSDDLSGKDLSQDPKDLSQRSVRPPSSSSSSLPPTGEEKTSCTTRSQGGADVLNDLEDEDVATWFHVVRGKAKRDESRIRVDPESGDDQWAVFWSDLDGAVEAYPAVDVEAELARMAFWLKSNRTKRKTHTGVGRFINGWLAKAQNNPSRESPNGSKPREWRDAAKLQAKARQDAETDPARVADVGRGNLEKSRRISVELCEKLGATTRNVWKGDPGWDEGEPFADWYGPVRKPRPEGWVEGDGD